MVLGIFQRAVAPNSFQTDFFNDMWEAQRDVMERTLLNGGELKLAIDALKVAPSSPWGGDFQVELVKEEPPSFAKGYVPPDVTISITAQPYKGGSGGRSDRPTFALTMGADGTFSVALFELTRYGFPGEYPDGHIDRNPAMKGVGKDIRNPDQAVDAIKEWLGVLDKSRITREATEGFHAAMAAQRIAAKELVAEL